MKRLPLFLTFLALVTGCLNAVGEPRLGSQKDAGGPPAVSDGGPGIPLGDAGNSPKVCPTPFDLTNVTVQGGAPIFRIKSADLNGDGILDLVFGTDLKPGFDVLLGLVDGGFAAPVSLGTGPVYDEFLADFDGDGRIDIWAVPGFAGSGGIHLNLGEGKFKDPPSFSLAERPSGVGDLDADGKPDLVIDESNQVSIRRNLGGGKFGSPRVIFTGAESGGFDRPIVADLNGDGLVDTVGAIAWGNLEILLAAADGSFAASSYSVFPYSASACGQSSDTVLIPRDGRPPDLASEITDYCSHSSTLAISRNAGDGTFFDGGSYSGLSCSSRLFVVDLNGDCNPDILVTSELGCGDGGPLSASYGQDDGTFEGPVNIPVLPPRGALPITVLYNAAPVGPVGSPRALAIVGGRYGEGFIVLGNASTQ